MTGDTHWLEQQVQLHAENLLHQKRWKKTRAIWTSARSKQFSPNCKRPQLQAMKTPRQRDNSIYLCIHLSTMDKYLWLAQCFNQRPWFPARGGTDNVPAFPIASPRESKRIVIQSSSCLDLQERTMTEQEGKPV